MTNMPVYQIVLRASGEKITVSLYSGETLAGRCKSHTGSGGQTQTLSCDRVTADRVRLTMTGSSIVLNVYGIKVTRVTRVSATIGLSARILSSETTCMCASRWWRVSGSAFFNY